MRFFRCVALALLVAATSVWPARVETQSAPILILVSFDGWRWDYIDHANVPNLKAMAARGTRSEGMIPSFPSVTFPNHYTLVTGLYPEHHGIVSNVMADKSISPGLFTMSSATANDPRWWGGEPIWTTAIRQGRKSASMFWPGSEAVKPTLWKPFDDKVTNAARVKQLLDWLALPEGERPSFLTVYFSEVDHEGHDYGPLSREVLTAAEHLDASLGQLVDGVQKLGLADRTSFVVVSDHGMSATSESRLIFIDDYIDMSTVDVIDWSPLLGIAPKAGRAGDLYQTLHRKHPSLSMYTRETMPAWLHYRDNARIPPVLGIADDGWTVTTHARFEAGKRAGRKLGGAHGFDPSYRSMHALFVAAGPNVRRGFLAPAFQNVHVYNFMCALLGLTPAANDGDPAATAGFIVR